MEVSAWNYSTILLYFAWSSTTCKSKTSSTSSSVETLQTSYMFTLTKLLLAQNHGIQQTRIKRMFCPQAGATGTGDGRILKWMTWIKKNCVYMTYPKARVSHWQTTVIAASSWQAESLNSLSSRGKYWSSTLRPRALDRGLTWYVPAIFTVALSLIRSSTCMVESNMEKRTVTLRS